MDTIVDIEYADKSDIKSKPVNRHIEILWIDISNLNEFTRFSLCCFTIFFFFLIYGYAQEYIFSFPGFRPFGWFLTLIQFFCYACFAWVEGTIRQLPRSTIPTKIYMILALLTLGCIGFSNSSLIYLNYPTQVIFKCCKLIPIMIGGILILNKRYKLIDYAATISMCLGLIAFTLANSHMSPDFNILGIVMIMCALVCDAIMGNFQEKVLKENDAPNPEIVFHSYSFGFLYLLVCLIITNNFFNAFIFCLEHPLIYLYMMLFVGSGYLGVQAILMLVKNYCVLTAVTVTTCRKTISIVISFLLFQKPFTVTYIWSGLLIIFGIYLNVTSKTNRSLNLQNIVYRVKHFFIPKGRGLLSV